MRNPSEFRGGRRRRQKRHKITTQLRREWSGRSPRSRSPRVRQAEQRIFAIMKSAHDRFWDVLGARLRLECMIPRPLVDQMVSSGEIDVEQVVAVYQSERDRVALAPRKPWHGGRKP